MIECTMTNNLSSTLRHVTRALVLGIVIFCQNSSRAQEAVDVVAYFVRIQDARGAGLARKTKPVDARPAKPGEVIVTMIKGEGRETQSPPAKSGDMVVRNRCPELGTNRFFFPLLPFRKGMKARQALRTQTAGPLIDRAA